MMEHGFLTESVTILLAGAAIAYVCFRLGLVPIVGFLVAGVVIGPHALGLVRDHDLVDAAAEVGVMLLLFTIGIEFSLEKLAKVKRLIFVGGGLQVVGASLAMTALLAAFGIGWRDGLFTGFLVALSSTAIVLKLLADRGESNAPYGQIGLGLLIFQDLAVIVMVLLVPMLAGTGGSGLGIFWALAKAGLLIAGVLLVARRVMPAVLETVARTCSPELFLLTVIAICFGTAYLTNLAGVSLSLGAFLAGLVVSESRFSEHAMSQILPLQILFSATFFVSVGMLLDVLFLVTMLPLVLLVIAGVLVVKVATTALGVRLLGNPTPIALASGLILAQVGEFSFVLERAGRTAGLSAFGLAGSGSQVFIAATVVLMVATPLLTSLGARLACGAERPRAADDEATAPPALAEPGLENHVVVAGYGETARRLVRVLAGSRIPYVITTLSPEGATEAASDGLPVMLGDATKQRTLVLAGAERAKMLVIADDDPAMARRIAAVARIVNPTMRILVRTRYIAEVGPLVEAGADRVVADELESVVQLFADVMRGYDLPPEQIEAHEDAIRRGGYAALRDGRGDGAVVECALGPDCLDRRSVAIRAGAPAAGQTVRALRLWERFGVTVERLRRNGESTEGPSDDATLLAGDEILMAGSAAAFADAAPLFRVGSIGEAEAAALDRAAERRRIDTERTIELEVPEDAGCTHGDAVRPVRPSAPGCEDCLKIHARWVHLRICMSCGHVGCCDSSPNRHATKHFHQTQHPVMRSLEPGEDWGWCFLDEVTL